MVHIFISRSGQELKLDIRCNTLLRKITNTAKISNYITQNTAGCNYFSMSKIPALGAEDLTDMCVCVCGVSFRYVYACIWDRHDVFNIWSLFRWYESQEGKRTKEFGCMLMTEQNGCHFTNDIFKYLSFNENIRMLASISLKFVYKGPIHNMSELIQVMAWYRQATGYYLNQC